MLQLDKHLGCRTAQSMCCSCCNARRRRLASTSVSLSLAPTSALPVLRDAAICECLRVGWVNCIVLDMPVLCVKRSYNSQCEAELLLQHPCRLLRFHPSQGSELQESRDTGWTIHLELVSGWRVYISLVLADRAVRQQPHFGSPSLEPSHTCTSSPTLRSKATLEPSG